MQYPDSLRALMYFPYVRRAEATVDLAVARLPSDLRPHDHHPILAAFGASLRRTLDQMSLPVVAHEMHKARSGGRLCGGSPHDRYRSFFVRGRELTPEARGLPVKYPRLFSAMETVAVTSATNVVVCLERLATDRAALEAFSGRRLGGLAHLEMSGSDRHRGGRQVLLTRFADGLRLVYKPTDLRPNAILQWFVGLLNLPNDLAVKVPGTLPRAGYGWVEFIPFRVLASASEAASYYRRAGALLAVCDVVGLTDGHFENLVACGAQPVLVDCETVFQNQRVDDFGPGEERSILATGLLQRMGDEQGGRGLLAAFQVAGPRRNHYLFPHAINERTDELAVRFQGSLPDACLNFPVRDGWFESPLDHEESFVSGMLDAYGRVNNRQEHILGHREFWRAAAGLRVRQLVRATMYYLLLIRRLEQPGAAESLEAALSDLRTKLTLGADHRANALVDYETTELLGAEIPVFFSCPGRRVLLSGRGDRYSGFFSTEALEQVRQRIKSLDSAYCQRQVEIARYHLPLAPRRHPLPEGAAELMRARGAEL